MLNGLELSLIENLLHSKRIFVFCVFSWKIFFVLKTVLLFNILSMFLIFSESWGMYGMHVTKTHCQLIEHEHTTTTFPSIFRKAFNVNASSNVKESKYSQLIDIWLQK